MKKPKLKSLIDHNAEARQSQSYYFGNGPVKNGIACPDCGEELFDTNPMLTLTTHPAQKKVHCTCGYSGYRIA